ncbi:PPE family protein [Leptospira kirschneri str. 200803703]|uniref:LA_2272/LA_2273 family lipoprotein n=1 Tax=Leptospira kirschneri TaxID=29507 RepID=UPI00028831E8|nr:hypothetical protein [Leptospira kirschneri]EKP04949.1 PPE family protein [Leptospira kirschneri str. 2008720114]EMK16290.1 PPE family protein [Leptospira kirschneri serovar Bim str. PUO 1247]EMN04521.1 PPE family protein [Leptospira kirschneri serovar Bim str. 1051]EMO69609.1 PPE family protein [Leptospira kirschneri str. 200803703]
MKYKNFIIFHFVVSFFKITVSTALFLNCGVTGLSGSKSFIRIPVRTETEVFHTSLSQGEVKNLYGINLGVINTVKENLVGIQVGGANISQGNTYAATQVAFYNTAKKAGLILQAGGSNKVQGVAGIQLGFYNSESGKKTKNVQVTGATSGEYSETQAGMNKEEEKGIIMIQAGGINQAESSTGIQVGLYNEEKRGVFTVQAGGLNFTEASDTGIQLGIYNAKTTPGLYLTVGAINSGGGGVTLGIINSKNSGAGLNAGILYNSGGTGINVGAINGGTGVNLGVINSISKGLTVGVVNSNSTGFNIGAVNQGIGFNLGVLNINNDGKGFNIGALNISGEGNFQIGVINICPNGVLPITILVNYCYKD